MHVYLKKSKNITIPYQLLFDFYIKHPSPIANHTILQILQYFYIKDHISICPNCSILKALP